MFLKFVFIVSVLILTVFCDEDDDNIENNVIGINAVHGVKIDKDTVITKNLKPFSKKKGKNTAPDWSYDAIPNEVQQYVTDFKKNMSECLKEVHAKDKRPVKRLSPAKESPVHGDCLIACVLKRSGVIINKKIHKENLINLVEKFYSKETAVMKKLEKNVDRCIASSTSKYECTLAAQLNECTNGLMMGNKHKMSVNY